MKILNLLLLLILFTKFTNLNPMHPREKRKNSSNERCRKPPRKKIKQNPRRNNKRKHKSKQTNQNRRQRAVGNDILIQHDLDDCAIQQGYGYKTANLIVLQRILEDETLNKELDKYSIRPSVVPDFCGISSDQIQELFKKNGFDILSMWEKIRKSNNQFLTEAQAFSEKILDTSLNEQDLFSDVIINNFLKSAEQEKWRLMVRSTGKEDTDELSNAGGNYSAANVSPEKQAILDAIKRVVASYFSSKSLSQRISAGDQTIFDKPLTPVLLQKMIGEELNGAKTTDAIPIGCVVYTQDPDSRTDAIIIQSSWGHNEGVVNSFVALDTFHVKSSINSVIKSKPERFIPTYDFKTNTYDLNKIQNDPSIKDKASLSNDAIQAIFCVSRAIQKEHGKPMDIELIYEPTRKIIYIVQARPLQMSNSNPSYIKDITNQNIIPCSIVSVADARVRQINNNEQLITAASLDQALNKYNVMEIAYKKKIRAVIVSGSASKTSHAAAIFRGDNIAILKTNSTDLIMKRLKANDGILVDTQREIVCEIPIDQEDFCIIPGWFTHPIAQQITINNLAPLLDKDMFSKKYFRIWSDQMNLLIEKLKAEDTDNAKTALNTIIYILDTEAIAKLKTYNRIKNNPMYLGKAEAFKRLYDQQIILCKNAIIIARDISKTLEQPPRSLDRLYAINFLEALLNQKKDPSIIDSFSRKTVSEDLVNEVMFIEKTLNKAISNEQIRKLVIKDRALFSLMKTVAECSMTDKLEIGTVKFLSQIPGVFEKQSNNRNNLDEMLSNLDSLGVLPLWINTLFAEELKKDSSECFNELFDEYKKSKVFLQDLQLKKDLLGAYDISRWSNPRGFNKKIQDFQNNIGNFFLDDEFINSVKNGTRLSKQAALETMHKLIDVWDQSIKELKGSTQYSDIEDKVSNFNEMLKVYLRFLGKWNDFIPWKLQRAKRALDFDFKCTKEQLIGSNEFNVETCARLEDSYQAVEPKTSEDLFTYIHQSLINLVEFKSTTDINLPEHANNIKEILASLKLCQTITYPSNIQINKSKVKLKFNIPLREHSLQAALTYNKVSKQTFLKLSMDGENEKGRWNRVHDIMELVEKACNIRIINNEGANTNITIKFKVDKNYKYNLKKLIKLLISSTYNGDGFDYRYILENNIITEIASLNTTNESIEKQSIVNNILDFSLKNTRAHLFLPQALKFNPDAEKIQLILSRFNDDDDYKINTQLFICKQFKDPRGWSEYYNLTKENAEKTLKIKNDSLANYNWWLFLLEKHLELRPNRRPKEADSLGFLGLGYFSYLLKGENIQKEIKDSISSYFNPWFENTKKIETTSFEYSLPKKYGRNVYKLNKKIKNDRNNLQIKEFNEKIQHQDINVFIGLFKDNLCEIDDLELKNQIIKETIRSQGIKSMSIESMKSFLDVCFDEIDENKKNDIIILAIKETNNDSIDKKIALLNYSLKVKSNYRCYNWELVKYFKSVLNSDEINKKEILKLINKYIKSANDSLRIKNCRFEDEDSLENMFKRNLLVETVKSNMLNEEEIINLLNANLKFLSNFYKVDLIISINEHMVFKNDLSAIESSADTLIGNSFDKSRLLTAAIKSPAIKNDLDAIKDLINTNIGLMENSSDKFSLLAAAIESPAFNNDLNAIQDLISTYIGLIGNSSNKSSLLAAAIESQAFKDDLNAIQDLISTYIGLIGNSSNKSYLLAAAIESQAFKDDLNAIQDLISTYIGLIGNSSDKSRLLAAAIKSQAFNNDLNAIKDLISTYIGLIKDSSDKSRLLATVIKSNAFKDDIVAIKDLIDNYIDSIKCLRSKHFLFDAVIESNAFKNKDNLTAIRDLIYTNIELENDSYLKCFLLIAAIKSQVFSCNLNETINLINTHMKSIDNYSKKYEVFFAVIRFNGFYNDFVAIKNLIDDHINSMYSGDKCFLLIAAIESDIFKNNCQEVPSFIRKYIQLIDDCKYRRILINTAQRLEFIENNDAAKEELEAMIDL